VGRADFGEIDPLQTTQIERTFVLRNDTRKPLTIERLQASCGCERLTLRKGGKAVPKAILRPGEQAEARVVLNLTRQRAGIRHVYAWAYGRESTIPLATLELQARIKETIVFTPRALNFGQVASGQTPSLSLSAAIDARLIQKHRLDQLYSSNPNVEVAPEEGEQRVERNGQTFLVRRYRVSLTSRAPVGYVFGALYFAPDSPKTGGTSVSVPVTRPTAPTTLQSVPSAALKSGSRPLKATPLLNALMGAVVPLNGEVTGSITATPRTVVFGTVPAGSASRRQVLLSGVSPQVFNNLKVNCDSPWLSVALQAPESENGRGAMRILEVTLSEQTPPGVLRSRVTVAASDGTFLLLTVIAEVMGKSPR